MPNRLWQTALTTIRDSFAAGALKHPDTRCIVVHVSSQAVEAGRKDDMPPISSVSVEKLVQGSAGIYGDAHRRLDFYGERVAIAALWNLGERAGRALKGVPRQACRALSDETLSYGNDRARWFYAAFDFAWASPGTPLYANKREWVPETWGTTFLMHDPETQLEYFYSELRDAFGASADAIDILLSGEKTEGGGADEGSEEWSVPMSRAEVARRYRDDLNARPRDLEHSPLILKSITANRVKVRLDTLDRHTRARLEKPRR